VPTVMMLGATGLVGSECLKLMLNEPTISRVVVLARRTLPATLGSAKLSRHVVDLERLDEARERFAGVDAIVCALGTTMKQAGSKERFRAVDYGIPLAAAKIGLAQGVRQYVLVSSLGANAHSPIFYNRVKGDLEEALGGLGFESLTILRPSFLLGARAEFRMGEAIAKVFAPFIPGKMRGIPARDVARCAVLAVQERPAGKRVVESPEIRAWASGDTTKRTD
jgi:uncharacterized protein YbjT (DUF2867 family)